ncbi:MAG: WYL domain-containing protein, partial [Pseudonocardiaceae bacterium]
MEEVIRLAIRERRPVALEYRRPEQGLRTVHPHMLYRAATGTVCVDTYQVEGYTSSGHSLPGWRAFELDQVVSAEPLDGRFALAPDFN